MKKNKKITKPKLKKDSELMSKRNAKYLDEEYLGREMVNKNKWWMTNAEIFKSKLTKSATATEKVFMKFLKSKKEKMDPQRIIYLDDNCIINKFYIADIYLPHSNVVVEIDGGYHETKEQIQKDYDRDEDLISCGYRVFRCTNDNVLKSPEVVYTSLLNFCKSTSKKGSHNELSSDEDKL